jgi:DNA repair protein RecN (Recombination protein N)
LGGAAAAVVAKKLEELAARDQVLVVSHLPQIASRATTHFRIEKTEQAGRVVTDIQALNEDGRIHEIARMIAGESITDSALSHAREMLGARLL